MSNNQRAYLTGTIAATLYWFLNEMFNPALSLYVSGLHFSAFQISFIFAAQTFIPFIFTIQIGYIADQIGQKNMILIGSCFMIAGSFILLLFNSFWALLIVQTLVGLGHIAIWLSSQSIVTFVDASFREKSIARMSLFTALGQLTGPLFGGMLTEHFNYRFVFITYLVFSFVFLAMNPFFPKPSKENKSQQKISAPSLMEAYRSGGRLYVSNAGIQVATMISFSLAYVLFIRTTYLPIYLEEKGYSPAIIGALIALWSFASIVIRSFSAWMVERWGRLAITAVSLILSLLGLIGFSLFPSFGGLIICLALVGVGTGLNQPLAISLVSSATKAKNRGLGMGIRLMSNRLANWLCPISLGTASTVVGLGASFLLVSFPLAAVSVSSIVMLKKYLISPTRMNVNI